MDESVQLQAGQTGFSVLRMITQLTEARLHLNLEHAQQELPRPLTESPSSSRLF